MGNASHIEIIVNSRRRKPGLPPLGIAPRTPSALRFHYALGFSPPKSTNEKWRIFLGYQGKLIMVLTSAVRLG
jgi:hypothetical protein